MALRPEDRFASVDEFIHALCDTNYQATLRASLPAAGANRTISTMLASTHADKITKLTVSGHDMEPAWSPDSQWVAFTSERDGNTEVYIINAQGQMQSNLSNSPGSDMQPAWRP